MRPAPFASVFRVHCHWPSGARGAGGAVLCPEAGSESSRTCRMSRHRANIHQARVCQCCKLRVCNLQHDTKLAGYLFLCRPAQRGNWRLGGERFWRDLGWLLIGRASPGWRPSSLFAMIIYGPLSSGRPASQLARQSSGSLSKWCVPHCINENSLLLPLPSSTSLQHHQANGHAKLGPRAR